MREAQAKRPQDVTVLVVDDDPDILAFFGSVLEDAGMNVVTAPDGASAMARIAEATPDLISLDLVMPGKSGIRLLRELRRSTALSRIPVLIVTGHGRDEAVKHDLDDVLKESSLTGPSLYLEKPVTPERYLECVCRTLGVEREGEVEPPRERVASLRRELEKALAGADEGAMVEALAALTGKQKGHQR